MLEVQKYLHSNSLQKLQEEFSIRTTFHPELPLVILNYDMIDSPKVHTISRDCRALVLENNSWDLVAKSFSRFFNWGEVENEMKLFNFNNFSTTSKEDGSLCIIYNYKDKWYANTRSSFGSGKINDLNKTWQEAFLEALGIQSLQDLPLDPKLTYVCEFCSIYNKVVRSYKKPKIYFLTAFWKEKEVAITPPSLFYVPERFHFNSIDQITYFLQERAEKDATFEGVVICDDAFQRWKIKNPLYLSLHQSKGNNEFSKKNVLPWVVSGDHEEYLTYFPEASTILLALKEKVDREWQNLVQVWQECHSIENQKEFALAIVKRTRFSSILFKIRKGVQNVDILRKEWKEFVIEHPDLF